MSKVHSNSVTQGQGEYIKYVFVYKKDKHGFVNYFLLRALNHKKRDPIKLSDSAYVIVDNSAYCWAYTVYGNVNKLV